MQTRLSHWLATAELDEVASVVRELEFMALHRSFAAQKAQATAAFEFWRGLAATTADLVKRLEKQSELRRARRAPDVRAAASGERDALVDRDGSSVYERPSRGGQHNAAVLP